MALIRLTLKSTDTGSSMHLIFPSLLLPSLLLGPESLIFKLLHAGLEVKTKELELNKNAINFFMSLIRCRIEYMH